MFLSKLKENGDKTFISVFELPTVTLKLNGIHPPLIEDGGILPNRC